MALGSINFVEFLFISYVVGLTSAVGDSSKHVTDGLADVAHICQFELAVRLSGPEWYSDGIRFFTYLHNGFHWIRRKLTWDVVRPSRLLKAARVTDAAEIVFRLWSFSTQFRFRRARPFEDVDIKISFVVPSDEVEMVTTIMFPTSTKILDYDGVTIFFNDLLGWNHEPGTEHWLNFDFALLREVTRCLGAAENLEQQSILHRSRDILKHRGPLRLREYDVKTIQSLYGWLDSSEEEK